MHAWIVRFIYGVNQTLGPLPISCACGWGLGTRLHVYWHGEAIHHACGWQVQ